MTIPSGPSGPRPGDAAASPESPEEIRRQIERTQDAISEDVDKLTEKVTPGRIVERRMERARSTATRWKDKVMGSNPAHEGGSARDTVRDTAQQVSGRVSGGASGAADAVSGTASSAASGVSEAASGAASAVSTAVSEAPRVARQQAQGNPLAAGLIAFGAGWLVSSLLPASRREQALAEQAKERATDLGKPAVETAKQVATEVKDNLAGPAQEAVGSVRDTASEAGRTVAEEGRSAAGQVQEQAQESAGNVRQNASP